MADDIQIQMDAPIPGMGMTAPLGGRPWQQPPQMATVEQAMEYYVQKLEDPDFVPELLTVIELGVPLTTLANTMQLASVMEGKHSVDVGMLILPVLVELIMLVADSAGVKYTTGLEKDKEIRGSLVDLAVRKFNEEKTKEEDIPMTKIDEEPLKATASTTSGLMSRSK